MSPSPHHRIISPCYFTSCVNPASRSALTLSLDRHQLSSDRGEVNNFRCFVEEKQNRGLQESPKIEKNLNSDIVSKQKVGKLQSVVSSSEVERKGDVLFESSPNMKKKRYSVFQAWSKLKEKQSLVATASRKRDGTIL